MIMRYYINPVGAGLHIPNSFYKKFDYKEIHANRKYAYRVQQECSLFPYNGEFYVCRKVYRYPVCLLGTVGFYSCSCGELIAEIYDRFEQVAEIYDRSE